MHPLIGVLASIGIRKLFMLSFILVLSQTAPSIQILLLFLLFLLSYWLVYFYNDFFDLKKDKVLVPSREKVLAMGKVSLTDYFKMFGLVSLPSLALLTLFSPVSAWYTLLAVVTNNLRTHITRLAVRELLLVFVELFNLLALWHIVTTSSPPLLVLLTAASVYALMHAAYKKRNIREILPASLLILPLLPLTLTSLNLKQVFAFLVVSFLYLSILLLYPGKSFETLQRRHGIALLYSAAYLFILSWVGV